MVHEYRPRRLAKTGCATLTAATLIGHTAGAEPFQTDAHFARQAATAPIPVSCGQRQRHRLHRAGDRQLNRARHTITITRARRDPETRADLDRKMTEAKTRKEPLRCLKRHLARRFYRLLTEPIAQTETRPTNTLPKISCLT
jgi:transposase